MSSSLVQAEFTYSSGTGTETYYFTVVYNTTTETTSVRNIQNGYGQITSPWSPIPSSVTDDICTATDQVENLMASTSSVNGTLTFTSSNEESVIFATAMADTSYRVVLSSDSYVPLRITSKTTTGFTVEAGATFTGTVGYDVFA